MESERDKIAIIGSGFVGRSWAMLFASAGYEVAIYDSDSKQIHIALADIEQKLKSLEKEGFLRGKLNASQQYAFIQETTSLSEAVANAILIQESVPENLEIKKEVWRSIDDVAGPNTIYSSSTSAIIPSAFSAELRNRQNFVVSHPVNPPYYVPLVEIVPAPWTDPKVVKKTRDIMESIGQTAVVLSREIQGFVLNRIQCAILNETWDLVIDGILDVRDIDKVMSDGLGPRYAFMGPLETCHLNADGFQNFCDNYFSHSSSMTLEKLRFTDSKVDKIAGELEKLVPLNQLQARRNWRDACLAKLNKLKKEAS